MLGAIVLFVPGCSLLIDVEPNCDTVVNCEPYICNVENTACLGQCETDLECAPGYSCYQNGTCLEQGCLVEPPIALFTLGGTGFEYDIASFNGGYWAIASSSLGVGLIQIQSSGEVVGGDDPLQFLDTDPQLPVEPIAIANEERLSLFWRGSASLTTEDLRFFQLTSAGTTIGPHSVFTNEFGQLLDSPAALQMNEGILLGWVSYIERLQVLVSILNGDGSFGEEMSQTVPVDEVLALTSGTSGAGLPHFIEVEGEDAIALVRRKTDAGVYSIVVSYFTDSLDSLENEHTVSDLTNDILEPLSAVSLGRDIAVSWIETDETGRTLYSVVSSPEGVVSGPLETQDYTQNPSELSLVNIGEGYGMAWIAEEGEEKEIFFRRYDNRGSSVFSTFRLTAGSVLDPGQVRALSTDSGAAVFWVDFGYNAPRLFMSEVTCPD
jgi:hypothetical protein